MSKSAKWLPLGLMAGAVLALIAAFGVGTTAQAQAPSVAVTIDSPTLDVAETAAANLTVTPTGVTVGAMDLTVTYPTAYVSVDATTGCSTTFGVCNSSTAGTVSFALAQVSGITGTAGTITFTGTALGSGPLAITITTCADETGTDISSNCTATDGTITVAAATATPTESPTPTPAPGSATPTPVPGSATPTPIAGGGTATPTATAVRSATPTAAGLPRTGGSDSDGMGALPFALGALGLAVVAGGVWAVARMRRAGM